MRRLETGSSSFDLLFFLAMLFLVGVYFGYPASPADSSDVKSVVALAAASSEASTLVRDALKANPNPSVGDISTLKKRVDEILVTEQARELTGDKTLKTPTEIRKAEEQAEAARRKKLLNASWDEMSEDEKMELVYWRVLVVVAFTGALVGGFALWKKVSNPYG